MNTSQKKDPESGQVLILLTLAMVVLLGFLALAIDGGMVYADRRITQNAVDAAALAGAGDIARNWGDAYEDCASADAAAKSAAQNNAGANEFTLDPNLANQNGVTTDCVYGIKFVDHIDVEVMITQETQTALMHFVYNGPLINTVEAIARVYPSKPVGEGNSIISLTDECQGNQKGTVFNGGIDVYISNGGGIFSNSCLIGGAQSGEVIVDDPGTISYFNDDGYKPGNTSFSPPPQDVSAKNKPEVDQPDCSIYSSKTNMPGGDDVTIGPGLYKEIKMTNSHAALTMNAGLYCIEDGFTFNGESLNGSGITIRITGDKKGVSISADAEVHLLAPPADCGGPCTGHAVEGVLLYVDPAHNVDVNLMGNSLSTFSGTVYAPGSEIKIGGNPAVGDPNGTVDYTTQIIGDTVKVAGTSDVAIIYDENKFAHTHSKLEMAR
jgi:Flp pilus assembly protein TadG